jgi:hypothetical protein
VELSDDCDRKVAEEVLLYHTGLLIDLRSPSERSSRRSEAWMSLAAGGAFEVQTNKFEIREPRQERTALRLEPLLPERFFQFAETNWLNPQQKAQMSFFKLVDGAALDQMRMDILNERGLLGMYEAILETGKAEFAEALKAITHHLEYVYDCGEEQRSSTKRKNQKKKPVVINCVQGKDRTGLLVMLCQCIVNVSDEDIVEDYSLSGPQGETSNILTTKTGGGLDRSKFNGAPKHVMEGTLEYIRNKYGSVCPGYLDSIGFDRLWQSRLNGVITTAEPDTLHAMV